MRINDVISCLQTIAPPFYQEHYDNAGLITGDPGWECSGIMISLDAIVDVIKEAIEQKCNLIVSHHPIIFRGLKQITGKNYVEKAIIAAIKNDIAIYAIHTNLDNVFDGVNGKIAAMLGLQKTRVLDLKENTLKKLFTFVPVENAPQVRSAIFTAGGGNIGQYSQCSFNVGGTGTFKPKAGADPYIGEVGETTFTKELKIEVIFPGWLEKDIIKALFDAHPYEEVAFDIINLSNKNQEVGSGILGELKTEMNERNFLTLLKDIFKTPVIKHTALLGKTVRNVAVCGGAGSFLISYAKASGADAYITSDIKYHEFFNADSKIFLADIGHFESEQFTIDLLAEILRENFLNFAILKTEINTNPVKYYI